MAGISSKAVNMEKKDPFDQYDQIEANAEVLAETDVAIQEPTLYRVLLHNDDYTPMDFVVEILESVFQVSHERATKIMLDVHEKGMGICGVYTYEIAETKVSVVTDSARKEEYPLKCTMEQA